MVQRTAPRSVMTRLVDVLKSLGLGASRAILSPKMLRKIRLWWQRRRMRKDWDARARENARYYVATGQEKWSDAEFFASGEQGVAEEILTDMGNVCQGKDPRSMRVLEIGCGAGRLTRALANLFGEVHAVDVSGEMIEQARHALSGCPNAHAYQNNGCDLALIPPLEFDFAFSFIVFQHIPSREIIENYVREVHRLLRSGALFKFQVQGSPGSDGRSLNTWTGASFSVEQATRMAERTGFDLRFHTGAGEQYFWLWYFKK